MIEDPDAVVDGNFAAQSEAGRLHVAIIMDGNGRWAEQHGLPRSAGHAVGAEAVDRIVQAALELPIGRLSLFALSSDNLARPPAEVNAIFELMRTWLLSRAESCLAYGVRLSFLGRRDRIPDALLSTMESVERATASGSRLHVRLAVDYSSRDAIVRAARYFNVHAATGGTREGFGRVLAIDPRTDGRAEDVDLLIRTGGEQRLSDFLLWECAYAELLFSPRWWPDFDATALAAALAEYHRRDRRFGRIEPKETA